MKRNRSNALLLLALGSGSLIGCGAGGGSNTPPPRVTLTISPQPASIPVNTTVTFTSTVSSGTNSPGWSLVAYDYGDLGSPDSQIGGSTFVYTAPSAPPIYNDQGGPNTPGVVTLSAVQYDATASITFTITAPSVTVGLSPTTITVPLGGMQPFTAYAVGNLNNALAANVNGVAGGTPAVGTIVAAPSGLYGQYTYTAPATMPITGSKVTVTVVSQADPTKSASAVVTLK